MLFAVGFLEESPYSGRNGGRPVPILVTGIGDDELICARQVLGAEAGVIQVDAEPTGGGDPQESEHGGGHPSEYPESGVTLADVVEEGCPGNVPSARAAGEDEVGCIDPMALIHYRLLPEQRRQPIIEQTGHLGFFAGRERPGTDRAQGAPHQVESVGRSARVITHAIRRSSSHTTHSVMKSRDPSRKKSSANKMMNPNCSNWR